MNPFRSLFDQYQKGLLREAQVDDLNRYLVEAYFGGVEELTEDEILYTEDLLFEQYLENKLEPAVATQLEQKLDQDPRLRKKFDSIKLLKKAVDYGNKKRFQHLAEEGNADVRDEEQLRTVLQEVFEKIQSEKERASADEFNAGFFQHFVNQVRDWFEEVVFVRGNLKPALIAASMLLLVGVVLFNVISFDKGQLAGKSGSLPQAKPSADSSVKPAEVSKDTNQVAEVNNNPPKTYNSQGVALNNSQRESLQNLMLEINPTLTGFNYTISRGISTTARDSIIFAAKSFNDKSYEACIRILNDLINRKVTSDSDTLSMLHFYLGSSYLLKAHQLQDVVLLKKALRSFSTVSPESEYYSSSVFYSVFANLGIGNSERSRRLLDTLIARNYPGNIEEIRNSIKQIIQNH